MNYNKAVHSYDLVNDVIHKCFCELTKALYIHKNVQLI